MERSIRRFSWTTANEQTTPSGNGRLQLVPRSLIVTSTSAKTVTPKVDSILTRHGIPEMTKSDNGAPFNNENFTNFATHLGLHHRKVTSLWSQANGKVEHYGTSGEKYPCSTCWKQKLEARSINSSISTEWPPPHGGIPCWPPFVDYTRSQETCHISNHSKKMSITADVNDDNTNFDLLNMENIAPLPNTGIDDTPIVCCTENLRLSLKDTAWGSTRQHNQFISKTF